MSRGMRRDGAFGGIEAEEGTKFLRAHFAQLKAEGRVEGSFEAWARQLGIVVASNHGWDDFRRRRVVSFDLMVSSEDRDDFRTDARASLEASAHLPVTGKRRTRRRRRPAK